MEEQQITIHTATLPIPIRKLASLCAELTRKSKQEVRMRQRGTNIEFFITHLVITNQPEETP